VIERFISLKPSRVAPPHLLEEAISVSHQQLPTPDMVKQLADNSMLGELFATGFREMLASPQISEDDLRTSLESKGRELAAKLQRYLNTLATIASAAPLLGLLGTVIGMIEIFGAQIGSGGLGSAVGTGNPAQLAHGISIALYNTAFGLIVAIPTLIFWRYFKGRVDAYLLTMELATERFMRHLIQIRRMKG
jgi:biopolymer transport protein ExbB